MSAGDGQFKGWIRHPTIGTEGTDVAVHTVAVVQIDGMDASAMPSVASVYVPFGRIGAGVAVTGVLTVGPAGFPPKVLARVNEAFRSGSGSRSRLWADTHPWRTRTSTWTGCPDLTAVSNGVTDAPTALSPAGLNIS
jgi:hypothetical protein